MHRVRYLVIGGYAVAFHARPRATKDVEAWIDRTLANAKRAQAAPVEFLGERISIEKLRSERTVLVRLTLSVAPIAPKRRASIARLLRARRYGPRGRRASC